VVFVHGSQDRGRDDAYDFSAASFYLERGVAVLLFDKRGVGGSTGDWHGATFDDLAGDVLAGVRMLRRRPDIDARQVGLQGVSQGGWIAPLAAARSRDVAFVVAISAAGVPPAEQVRHDQMRQIRADTLVPPAQYDEADAFIRLLYRALRDRGAAREYAARLPWARRQPWFRYTIAGIPPRSWAWETARLTANFDPEPVLRKVRVPVLLVFGEADPNYPARRSAALMERALLNGGNRDVTVEVFPGANHSLRVRREDGSWISAPGLTDAQHAWLLRHVNVDF
jgi:pimeloyl-ACP methyl ester carboxylesterase